MAKSLKNVDDRPAESPLTLQQFVSETLIQIVEGAKAAQERLGTSASVSPPKITRKWNSVDGSTDRESPRSHVVKFSIEVSGERSSKVDSEGGLALYVVTGALKGETASRSLSVNRIEFEIPLDFSCA